MIEMDQYEKKKQALIDSIRRTPGSRIRLGKQTSNLFRDRQSGAGLTLDVRAFDQVLHVDPEKGFVLTEGMVPYATLVSECLKHNVMPAVVPQLKSITIGGATAGCGIESSSFRYGLVHETVQEMEILLANGETIWCTPSNDHRDLFYGFPNSYGTLGYALLIKTKVIPTKKFVKLTHRRFTDPVEFLTTLTRECDRSEVDFVDGVVFGRDDMVLTTGQFQHEAPFTSDYTYRHIFYQSLRSRTEDYLTTSDYLWRWDTDWFWCSKNLWAQNPVIRRLYGKSRLNSVTYTKIMRWNGRWKLTHTLDRLLGWHSESVIQDVEIPVDRALEFLSFYHDEIQFMPMWVCPTRAYNSDSAFSLYRMDPEKLYLNFGFWDVIRGRKKYPSGYYNRKVESMVLRLHGIKSLYSTSYFSPDQFWEIYNKPAYEHLKYRYDADMVLSDLYQKCVLRE